MEIKLKITRDKDQELYLTAKTMNEIVEKIIEWQDYDGYVKIIKQFKKQPTKDKLEQEKKFLSKSKDKLLLFLGENAGLSCLVYNKPKSISTTPCGIISISFPPKIDSKKLEFT